MKESKHKDMLANKLIEFSEELVNEGRNIYNNYI